MKEYMKNKNEYRIGERLYIDEIKKCVCIGKDGDRYVLTCKIIQRGEGIYYLSENGDYISKTSYPERKKFWLSSNAEIRVKSAVEKFNSDADMAKNTFVKVDIGEIKTVIYYKHIGMEYEYLIERGNVEKIARLHRGSIYDILRDAVPIRLSNETQEDKEMCKIFTDCDRERIKQHPLYNSAVKTDDVLMQLQIKLNYNIATAEECEYLSEILGYRILPALSKEYNKYYTIDANAALMKILRQSGYTMSYVPNIAMNGSTRSKWLLNPNLKKGICAAKKGSKSITFDDFLRMFE